MLVLIHKACDGPALETDSTVGEVCAIPVTGSPLPVSVASKGLPTDWRCACRKNWGSDSGCRVEGAAESAPERQAGGSTPSQTSDMSAPPEPRPFVRHPSSLAFHRSVE